MKIVSINTGIKTRNRIPAHSLDACTTERVINSIAALMKRAFNEDPCEQEKTDYRKYAHIAVESFKETLLGRQLIKEHAVDEFFFAFVEESFSALSYNSCLKAV